MKSPYVLSPLDYISEEYAVSNKHCNSREENNSDVQSSARKWALGCVSSSPHPEVAMTRDGARCLAELSRKKNPSGKYSIRIFVFPVVARHAYSTKSNQATCQPDSQIFEDGSKPPQRAQTQERDRVRRDAPCRPANR